MKEGLVTVKEQKWQLLDGKKVKTKGAMALWYLEELFQQVPSFWTKAAGGNKGE